MLPKEELYMPPMNMRVRDHRQFGRKPTVGLYILKTMDKYRFAPLTDDHDPLADMPSKLNFYHYEKQIQPYSTYTFSSIAFFFRNCKA